MGSKRRQIHHLAAGSDDRISHLPESILGHILSCLPTKNAVATGAVSKRWRFLWTTIGNLDFCLRNHTEKTVEQFVKFVNHVMVLHKPSGCFNKFSLTWYNNCDPFYLHTWIYAALAKDVHELIIRADVSRLSIHVQSYLLSSRNLRSLELNCGMCISSEIDGISLPRLECLKLTSLVYFQSEEAFRKLLDACPVLKYLTILLDIKKMISCGYIKIVDGVAFRCRISSTSLKYLELCVGGSTNAVCSVELDTPSLECIRLEYRIRFVIRQRLNFLGDANIHVIPADQEIGDPKYCNSVVEAFQALSCARTLELSSEVISTLSRATIKMQTRFNRLTRLEVVIGGYYWSSIQNFIELSDNLEVLIVDKDGDYNDDNRGQLNNSNWTNPDVVPRCLSDSLRTVSIGYYDGCFDELAMVDYILKNGSVLKNMQIRFGDTFSGSNRKYELIQQIYTSHRKSTFCEFKFGDCDTDLAAM